MHIRHFFLFCSFTAALSSAEPLTLDDAIRLAWANDPSVAALALTPDLASAREVQATTRPNPELEVRAATPIKGDSEWSLGAGLSQRLPRRERIELARALARLGQQPTAHQIHEQRRKVAGEVRQVFYQIAVQQARRDSARQTHRAQAAVLASLERLHAAGEIGGADLELVRLEVARADQAVALAEAELAALDQRLRRRLRTPPDSPIEVRADLVALLDRRVSDASGALANHPSVALAELAVRQAEAALALSRTESKADWKVGAELDFERRANDATGKLENDPTLSVSASVPWPSGRIANRGDIMEKEAALRIAEANAKAVKAELLAELESAGATARALHPVVARYRETIAAADALPERLRAAYQRGEIGAYQLAQARQQRFSLEIDYLETAARYLTALAEAETAAGVMPSIP